MIIGITAFMHTRLYATIKEYQDKFDGLQGEGYYDEMLVSDLDRTLEAVNHGKLSHSISY